MNHNEEELIKAGFIVSTLSDDTQHCEWTADEIEELRNYYPIQGSNVYKRFDNKTSSSCVKKAQELKLKWCGVWTKEEDDILRKYYPTEGSEVCKRLEDRTQVLCIIRAKELGLKKKS
jgi:hypothetical protein